MNEFVRTGSDLKSAKLIIIDARSNSGGDDHFVTEWLKNYTGEKPEQKTIISNWDTAMYKTAASAQSWEKSLRSSKREIRIMSFFRERCWKTAHRSCC